MEDIKEMRSTISAIDEMMAQLFEKRMAEVKKLNTYKTANPFDHDTDYSELEVIEKNKKKIAPEFQNYYQKFQNSLFDLDKQLAKESAKVEDNFFKDSLDYSPLNEVVFKLSVQANEEKKIYGDKVINATLGSLHDEEGPLTTLKTVYDAYSAIDVKRKANYADAISGNPSYCEAVFNWLNRKNNIHLPHTVIATPGGSGAVSSVFSCCLNPNEIVLIPDIAWGSYVGMAAQNNLKAAKYQLFDGEVFALDAFKTACRAVMNNQHKLVVVINDPCQNPTGLSLGKEVWKELIAFFNEISAKGKVIVLDDIAYIDYGYDQDTITDYMEAFNDINDNVAVMMAFSCSKALTAYGMRTGAVVALAKQQNEVDHLYNVFNKFARAIWSNINNGFMDCFTAVVTEHKDEFMAEKAEYIALLKQRSELFMQQAKECDLPVYPYQEGFFITLRIEDNKLLDRYNEALINDHVFALKTNKGIRVAICGLSVKQCDGLAYRMKKILDECR